MTEINYTLLSEGTTDKALLAIIDWLFRSKRSDLAVNGDWANIAAMPVRLPSLAAKIRASIEAYPCDILFVHRDSDNVSPEQRRGEIIEALGDADCNHHPLICVIPIRMVEAWLLFDESAIRDAVGNPNGRTRLNLPPLRRLETLPNPKEILRRVLEQASELTGRRRKDFGTAQTLVDLSLLIEDYSPLRQLSAFRRLEADIQAYLETRD